MKVAICFCGHLRTFDRTINLWKKNLFEKYDTDVFMHMWSNKGLYRGNGGQILKNEVGTVSEFDDLVDLDYVDFLYQPKIMEIQNYQDVKNIIIDKSAPYYEYRDTQPDWMYTRPHDYVSVSYKRYLCNELRKKYQEENGVKYDVVIIARTDQHPTEDLLKYYHPDKLLFRSGHPADGDPMKVQSIVQEIIIGSDELATKFANIYIGMDEMFEDAKNNNSPGWILNHHTSTWYWLFKNQIPYEVFPYNSLETVR